MDTDVTFVNHASVLIRSFDNYILTDPWYDKPAFGSWLPSPCSFVGRSYLPTLAQTCEENFSILISHGHDDHLDDEYLSLFPGDTRILIPKFPAPGTRKRLESIGFSNIQEINFDGAQVGRFQVRSFIDTEESLYDSFFTIATEQAVVVHQNDNWKPYKPKFVEAIIKEIVNHHAIGNVIYMSQCNLADGYPYCYVQYSEEEKLQIAEERKVKMLSSALDNAARIGARYFLNYAGHATVFSDSGALCEPQTLHFVQKNMPNTNVKLLNMVPGDKFDFNEVIHPFSKQLDEDYLNINSRIAHVHSGATKRVDSQKLTSSLFSFSRSRKMKKYLRLLNDYVTAKLEKSSSFRPGISNAVIGLQEEESGKTFYVQIGKGLVKKPTQVHTCMIVSRKLLDAFLIGEVNWENLYIGYQCKVKKLDKKYNNGDIMRWLAMFGYVYQKFHT